jgi:hypothetical protein
MSQGMRKSAPPYLWPRPRAYVGRLETSSAIRMISAE